MRAIRRFTVRPVLPEVLQPLLELATNLRWSWHSETQDLFAATFEREKNKSEILEKTFRQALEKAQQEPNTKPRGIFESGTPSYRHRGCAAPPA